MSTNVTVGHDKSPSNDIFFLLLDWKKEAAKIDNTPQELRREGWTETAVILCKLNKSL